MFIKKVSCTSRIVIVVLLSNLSTMANPQASRRPLQNHHSRDIDISVATLQSDKLAIRKYILEKVANDIKKAKKWGKGMARTFGGISSYAFDAIPFEFFTDSASIEEAFRRLEEGVKYIHDLKDMFKKNMMAGKRKINQSQLAEFLYNQLVDKINITDAERVALKKESIKMDEFVRKGIVKRSEYMYYTLLNFVVRYYLEQELKR